MTAAANRPDLVRIAEAAVVEVLGHLPIPMTARGKTAAGVHPEPPEIRPGEIVASIHLEGRRLTATLRLHAPEALLDRAVHCMTGAHPPAGDPRAIREDAAGELANMIAGRVATRLAAEGYPCTLSTPSIAPTALTSAQTPAEFETQRLDLLCEGHPLSLHLQFRYAGP